MSHLNEELQSLFIHLPKCAGCSLGSIPWNKGSGHDSVADFEERGELDKASFVWTFVRNPWERILSAYEDCPEIFDEAPTFDFFIRRIHANRKELEGIKSLRFTSVPRFGFSTGRIHFQPMHLLLSDRSGKIRTDFVGRVENLQEDFDQVSDRLGVPRSKLPHQNRRAEKPNRRTSRAGDLYTPELADLVGEIYAGDLDLFPYSPP